MTPCILIRNTAKRFRDAGIPDPENDSSLLLSFLCGKPPLALRLDTDTELCPETVDTYLSLANRRMKREPLQYIVGEAPFLGRSFQVDSRVLIPRPETEELCRWALDTLPENSPFSLLDLCCGSGCIGLTVAAERPFAAVTLADISAEALAAASCNASRFHLRVAMHQGDLTEGLKNQSFDCIVSNPPYIPSEDCSLLQPEVLLEPRIALDGGTDGLAFYRRIAVEAARVLKDQGLLFLEVGYGESEDVSSLLSSAGFSGITVRNDFSGIPRMLMAVLPARRKTHV